MKIASKKLHNVRCESLFLLLSTFPSGADLVYPECFFWEQGGIFLDLARMFGELSPVAFFPFVPLSPFFSSSPPSSLRPLTDLIFSPTYLFDGIAGLRERPLADQLDEDLQLDWIETLDASRFFSSLLLDSDSI